MVSNRIFSYPVSEHSGGKGNHSGKQNLKDSGRTGNLWRPPRVKRDVEYKTNQHKFLSY